MATSSSVSTTDLKRAEGAGVRLLTRQQLLEGFAVVALPIFVWAIIALLRETPSWLLRLSFWDVIGMLFYGMAFAFVESIIVLALLIIVSLILPASLYRRYFVPVTSAIIVVTTVAFVVLHLNDEWIGQRALVPLMVWGTLWMLGLFAGWIAVLRSEQFRAGLERIVPNLVPLAYIYALGGIIGIFVVVARNLLG